MPFIDQNFLVLSEEDKQGYELYKKHIPPDGTYEFAGEVGWSNAVWKFADSLFPNQCVFDDDIRSIRTELLSKSSVFQEMLDQRATTEQALLNFIRDEKAYHLILGIFQNYSFGHHHRFIFREFKIGTNFQADFLLIGEGSGGVEFVWVELESPNSQITLSNGDFGNAIRKGLSETEDWEKYLNSNFSTVRAELKKHKSPVVNFSDEFLDYDPERMHYVVVGGRRADWQEKTYDMRRKNLKNRRLVLHYDNLLNQSDSLVKLFHW